MARKSASPETEEQRLFILSHYERQARSLGYNRIAGMDEVGRGPLAGPVVAAAVILPANADLPGIDDSKKLSPRKRLQLFHLIHQQAQGIGLASINQQVIDKVNIYQATLMAMYQAIAYLSPPPDYLLIDAVKLPKLNIPQKSIIKGDALSISIAAASIIAKVVRDQLMEKLDELYPRYGFAQHKGYGTLTHRQAIAQYGLCPLHRQSFCHSKQQIFPFIVSSCSRLTTDD